MALRIQRELARDNKQRKRLMHNIDGQSTTTAPKSSSVENPNVSNEKKVAFVTPPAEQPISSPKPVMEDLYSNPQPCSSSASNVSPLKSRKSALKSRVPTRHSLEKGNMENLEVEKVKKKLGAFAVSSNEEKLNKTLAEPLVNALPADKHKLMDNSCLTNTVEKFVDNNIDLMDNLMALLEEVEPIINEDHNFKENVDTQGTVFESNPSLSLNNFEVPSCIAHEEAAITDDTVAIETSHMTEKLSTPTHTCSPQGDYDY